MSKPDASLYISFKYNLSVEWQLLNQMLKANGPLVFWLA